MTADPETLRVYDARAEDYAAMIAADGSGAILRSFIEALPQGAQVLDLGCGPGDATQAMLAKGLDVDAVDASAAMIGIARDQRGLPARQATFDDLDAVAQYDGVWASFSLLHAPKADFPRHLAAIRRALRPGGMFYLGLKLGTGEERDPIGRFYAYYSADELDALLRQAGFAVVSERRTRDAGLSGVIAEGIHLISKVSDD